MRYYVGITDRNWFEHLRSLGPDEVNFWRPSANSPLRVLEPGAAFLFKLHSPHNFVVGGGFFVRYVVLPVSVAWLAYGEKNGVPDPYAFLDRVRHYRRDGNQSPDPSVGCILLTSPFFFPEDDWIRIPPDWHRNIQQGRTYDASEGHGAHLWAQVEERLQARQPLMLPSKYDGNEVRSSTGARFGQPYLARPRLGQGAFRVLVTEAYQRRCAITGERTLPVLEAAHIRPFTKDGPHEVRNGLLLRADLHLLFDRGYLSVTTDRRVAVSSRIREEYENGRDYYALEGRELSVTPRSPREMPAMEYVAWHNENIFVP